MATYIGIKRLQSGYISSKKIKKIYVGNDLVYQDAVPLNLTLTKNTGVATIHYRIDGGSWTSTSASATIAVNQGSTVDLYATAATGYNLNSPYSSYTQSNPYSFTMTAATSWAPTASLKTFTITFAKGGSNYGSWSSASGTAYYGDTLTRSGNTVTCYNGSSSTARWSSTFTNGSATGYTYTVSYNAITSPVTGAQTITATTSRTVNSYTYTRGTLPTGVASLTLTRDSSPNAGAATGTVANGGTIYYGDKCHFSATASTGYNVSCNYTTASSYTVTGAINTGVIVSGVSATLKTYNLVLTKNTGINRIYYKINGASSFSYVTATTTKSVNHGSTIYLYATAATGYHLDSSFSSYTSTNPYTISNVTAAKSWSPTASVNVYTLSIKAPTRGSLTTLAGSSYYSTNGGSSYTEVTSATVISVSINYGTVLKIYNTNTAGSLWEFVSPYDQYQTASTACSITVSGDVEWKPTVQRSSTCTCSGSGKSGAGCICGATSTSGNTTGLSDEEQII